MPSTEALEEGVPDQSVMKMVLGAPRGSDLESGTARRMFELLHAVGALEGGASPLSAEPGQ
jgi:hypothetical protein